MNNHRGTIKTCARCAQPMAVKTNRETGQEFLGCTSWPECEHTEPLPLDAQLRRMGAPELPGFGEA